LSVQTPDGQGADSSDETESGLANVDEAQAILQIIGRFALMIIGAAIMILSIRTEK
jgi:hypothetical protein